VSFLFGIVYNIFGGGFMKRYLLTLKSKEIIGHDYISFTFEKPEDLTFIEGQYGVFLHVDKEVEGRRMRAFSFASPNSSNDLVIGTKITTEPSDFKRIMRDLDINDTMTVDGPMGNFTYNNTKHAVFIAGGIGITPIRSIALTLQNNQFDNTLIYSDHVKAYPYKEDLDKVPFTQVSYVSGIEETAHSIREKAQHYQNDAGYYISGSPGFVSGILQQLQDLGIETTNIKYDRFTGY